MRELDYKAVEAVNNQQILNELTQQNELFILKCASITARRYITKNDDEWSIAMLAFVNAVQSYQLDKGNFLSFAKLLIRRRLIDYYRVQAKHIPEISVNPIVFDTASYEDDEDITIRLAVAEQVSRQDKHVIALEIDAVNQTLLKYGFSFMDLSKCSPRATKTKSACAKAAAYIMSSPFLMNEMISTKQLPLKNIEKNTKVPRKILERHRKYIIAAVEILSGEYPYLSEYLQYIKEEMKV